MASLIQLLSNYKKDILIRINAKQEEIKKITSKDEDAKKLKIDTVKICYLLNEMRNSRFCFRK